MITSNLHRSWIRSNHLSVRGDRGELFDHRLNDDEIAIATCLKNMAHYAAGGPDFYGLPEASQDHYLGPLIEQAIRTGETVTAVRQPWAEG
jgi:hypothetical protein